MVLQIPLASSALLLNIKFRDQVYSPQWPVNYRASMDLAWQLSSYQNYKKKINYGNHISQLLTLYMLKRTIHHYYNYDGDNINPSVHSQSPNLAQ